MSAFLLVSGGHRAGRAMLWLYNWTDARCGSITVSEIELELVEPKKRGAIIPFKPICVESGRDTTVDITDTLSLMIGDVAQTEVCITVKGMPAGAVSAKSQIFVVYQHRGYFHTFQFDRISG